MAIDTETIRLLDGTAVQIAKARPCFKAWKGVKPAYDYNGKPFIDFEDRPLFAELVILNTLEGDGWSGVWVDSFHRCKQNSSGEKTVLPDGRQGLLDRIFSVSGSKFGSFDIYAWKGEEILFAEAKHSKKRQNKADSNPLAFRSALNRSAYRILSNR